MNRTTTDENENEKTNTKVNRILRMYERLPYFCFASLLVIIYIGLMHNAEYKVRSIQSLKNEVKELRWEYMSLKSSVVYGSTRHQLQKEMSASQLGWHDRMPQRIIVNKEE